MAVLIANEAGSETPRGMACKRIKSLTLPQRTRQGWHTQLSVELALPAAFLMRPEFDVDDQKGIIGFQFALAWQ